MKFESRLAASRVISDALQGRVSSLPSPVRFWSNTRVISVDFSPSGDRALVGLDILSPTGIKYASNPVLIDVSNRTVVDLPPIFAAQARLEVKSHFARDGDAALFNRIREERTRGENVKIEYYSLVGLP